MVKKRVVIKMRVTAFIRLKKNFPIRTDESNLEYFERLSLTVEKRGLHA